MGRTKRFAAIAVAATCVFGLSLSAASAARRGCRGATTPATRLSTAAAAEAVRCLINDVRAAHGLPALHTSSRLGQAAERWVGVLVRTGNFNHGDIGARLHAAGVKFATAAENIGTGQATAGQVVKQWLSDVPHCQNILSPAFSEIGTGVDAQGIRGLTTGPSTWAVDFALPLGHRPPSKESGPVSSCPLY